MKTAIEMARKAVNYSPETEYFPILHTKEQIERFSALVREDEREANGFLAEQLQASGERSAAHIADADNMVREPVDTLRGFSLWLDREAWGHVIDGLMLERERSEQRKAANPESNSNHIANRCAELIAQIGQVAAAPVEPVKQEPVAWHEPNAYGNVTTHKKWAEENGWLPLYTKE